VPAKPVKRLPLEVHFGGDDPLTFLKGDRPFWKLSAFSCPATTARWDSDPYLMKPAPTALRQRLSQNSRRDFR
jgi:hypothetical protein